MESLEDEMKKVKMNTKSRKWVNIVIILVLILSISSIFIVYKLNVGGQEEAGGVVTKSQAQEENQTPVQEEVTEQNAVAKLQGRYYIKLQDAINEATEGGTDDLIEILKPINENVLVGVNKSIIINLNNNTMSNLEKTQPTMIVQGAVKIQDGIITGEYEKSVPTIQIVKNARLDMSNIQVKRRSNESEAYENIEVHGMMNLYATQVTSENSNAIYIDSDDESEITINEQSQIVATTKAAINNVSKGKITISSAIVSSRTSDAINNQNGGIIELIGSKITSEEGSALNNYGNINISESELTSVGRATIYNQSGASLNIASGTISSKSTSTIINQNEANLTITGGTISSETGNSINNSGQLNISSEPTIISNGSESPTIYNQANGSLQITGGRISNMSTNYDVYNNGGGVEVAENIISKKNW